VRIIFDENVPLPLRTFFPGHAVTTVQLEGWTGVENGAILGLVDGAFDVLVLADKNLRYQQNLTARRIALVELPTNRWPALQALAAQIVNAVENAQPGTYTVVAEQSA
jgi:hypothetical protein